MKMLDVTVTVDEACRAKAIADLANSTDGLCKCCLVWHGLNAAGLDINLVGAQYFHFLEDRSILVAIPDEARILTEWCSFDWDRAPLPVTFVVQVPEAAMRKGEVGDE